MVETAIVAVTASALGFSLVLPAYRRLEAAGAKLMVKASQIAGLAAIGSARCELTGTAASTERGLLVSPLTEQPCVWHRVAVHAVQIDDNGEDLGKPVELLSEDSSHAPILLQERDGVVVVDMASAAVRCPERTVVPVEREWLEEADVDLSSLYDDHTRFEQAEWIIPDGARLFVSGRPVTLDDQIGIGKPEDGLVTVSTEHAIDDLDHAKHRLRSGTFLIVASVTAVLVSFILL